MELSPSMHKRGNVFVPSGLSHALVELLRLPPNPSIAFVGAGGKTAALFAMAHALAPSIVTTTTHLAIAQSELADQAFVWPASAACREPGLEEWAGVVLITGEPDLAGARLSGLSAPQWASLRRWCASHHRTLLVEADGSRRLPLKAPAADEPAVPDDVDAVVVAAGMLGCGLPLDDEHVHRARQFAAISGCRLGEPVSPDAIAAVLVDADGGLKRIPRGARRAVLLNQADTPELQQCAAAIARRVRPAYDAVVVASLLLGRIEIV
jgi:molybdenum cofactor cytidylyltransferase